MSAPRRSPNLAKLARYLRRLCGRGMGEPGAPGRGTAHAPAGKIEGRVVPPRSKILGLAGMALAALALLVSLALAQPALADAPVTRIDVTGNRTIDAEAIRGHLK